MKKYKYTLTEKELDSLTDFYKDEDGSYSDGEDFLIRETFGVYSLNHFSKVENETWFIKNLKDLNDLKNVYHAITDKELKIK